MYAVIQDSGRQHKVSEGEVIDVDLREIKPGDPVEFDKVLYWTNGEERRIGAPYLDGAKVRGTVQEQIKGPKVVSYRYRRREQHRRKVGHRQKYLRVRITEIAVA